jgi:hypothetical protein
MACWAPLKIHFGGQTNLFDSGRRQEKAALASAKADFPSLPEYKNLLLAAQKQLLELPYLLIRLSGAILRNGGRLSHDVCPGRTAGSCGSKAAKGHYLAGSHAASW